LIYGCAEILGGESSETDGVKSFGPRFRAELEADGRIGAELADGAPKGKEFPGFEEHAWLMNKAQGKSGSAQDGRGPDSQFFQL
jgi:hypothetical protein